MTAHRDPARDIPEARAMVGWRAQWRMGMSLPDLNPGVAS